MITVSVEKCTHLHCGLILLCLLRSAEAEVLQSLLLAFQLPPQPLLCPLVLPHLLPCSLRIEHYSALWLQAPITASQHITGCRGQSQPASPNFDSSDWPAGHLQHMPRECAAAWLMLAC